MNLTPEERSQRARLAAYAKWARNDPGPTMQKARDAFREHFVDLVDPDRVLPEAERLRRAECARKEHYTRLAFRSVRARRARRAGGATDAA